jgi:hypothetical protein
VGLDVEAVVAVPELLALHPLSAETRPGRDRARRRVVRAVAEFEAVQTEGEGVLGGGGERAGRQAPARASGVSQYEIQAVPWVCSMAVTPTHPTTRAAAPSDPSAASTPSDTIAHHRACSSNR